MAGTARKTRRDDRVAVGEIVLFRIGGLGSGRAVPLLVTEVGRDAEGRRTVSGTLFTNGDEDAGEEWIVRTCFHRPTRDQATVVVRDVGPGRTTGTWRVLEKAGRS